MPDTALIYFEQALKLSEQAESPRFLGYSRRNIGMVREIQGMYDQALEEFFAALSIYEETGNKQGIASCYNDIAIIHYLQESFELCMEYLTNSFEIKQELVDINELPMFEQKEVLSKQLTGWMGNLEQVDDILVLGFRM